jgi:hypothetical protein
MSEPNQAAAIASGTGALGGCHDLLAHPDADALTGLLGSGHDGEEFVIGQSDALDVAAGVDAPEGGRERGTRDRLLRRARLRLLQLGGAAYSLGPAGVGRFDPVAYAEARSRACDARAALSLACGAHPDDIHPARGTWSAPT